MFILPLAHTVQSVLLFGIFVFVDRNLNLFDFEVEYICLFYYKASQHKVV